MRKAVVAALLILLTAGAALGQDAPPIETVEADGLDTLTGIWKIAFPDITWAVSLPLMRDGRLTFTLGDTFCRVTHAGGDEASVICLAGGIWRQGTATLDGKNLHVAWGNMMARMVIDTKLENTRAFSGNFGFKFAGIQHNATAPVTGQRFTVPDTGPDTAGKAGLVSATLTQLVAGAVITANDAIARQYLGAQTNTPAEVQSLGKLEAILYLGEGSRRQWPAKRGDPVPPPFLFSVYQVEFANGQRLCAVHLDGDGALDGFLCV
jgi:hypothetical protein